MVNTSDILPNTPRYLKVPLIFFNAILWILGVVLIAIGGYALKELQSIKGLLDVTLPAGLVVLGVFIVVLTIVGCAVAYKERLVGLIFYTIVMLLLLICLIGVGGGAFTYREKTPELLKTAWMNPVSATTPVRRYFEDAYTCCGWIKDDNSSMAASDPAKTDCVRPANTTTPTTYNTTVVFIPVFCDQGPNCTVPVNESCHQGFVDNTTIPLEPTCERTGQLYNRTEYNVTINGTTNIYTIYNPYNLRGCDGPVTAYVQDRLYVAAMAGVVVGVIEFICMLFSLFLIVRLCRSPRARSYD